MRRRLALLAVCAAGLTAAGAPATAAPAPDTAAPATAAPASTAPASTAPATTRPAGLPDGVPPAALRPEPARPVPRGWPAGSGFPRTSGTGRVQDGAALWTDFLYDDHGAKGAGGSTGVAMLAPTTGTYAYADPAARGNGADVFGSAVALTPTATVWRVDWTTLSDPAVPLAVWAVDSDADARTGTSDLGAGTGVTAAGIDHTLAVTASGAVLTDTATGRTTRLPTTVSAGSFVVAVPRASLPVADRARVRLVSAVADGQRAAPVAVTDGALPGQPAVYDVSYDADEAGTNWGETQQATSLAAGDVSAYGTVVDWRLLAERTTTPEAAPTGVSTRWYLADRLAGGGVVKPAATSIDPAFLSAPQPYVVDVPPVRAAHPPVTLLLHSSNSAHTQYATTAPKTLAQLCTGRRSICVTPLARGPSTWYFDASEVDLWQVWRQVALAYDTDPDRTVLGGYSMGGWATYRIGLTYPGLFARALSLEGRVNCGVGLDGGTNGVQQGGRCTTDGDTQDFVAGARPLPFVVAHSTTDELVPYPTVLSQVQAFRAAGLRVRLETYTGQDHVSFALADAFTTEVAALGGTPVRGPDLGALDLRWWSDLSDDRQGLGPTGVQWLPGVTPRVRRAGLAAGVRAVDHALPPVPSATTTAAVDATAVPGPALVSSTTWRTPTGRGGARTLELALTDLALVGVDTARARLPTGRAQVTTDGPTSVRLLALRPGTVVTGPDGRVPVSGAGTAEVPLAASGAVTWTAGSRTAPAAAGGTLPTTGPGPALPVAGLLLLVVAGRLGRARAAGYVVPHADR